MAFSNRSRSFLQGLKLSPEYLKSKKEYVQSLGDLIGEKFDDLSIERTEQYFDDRENTGWNRLLGWAEIVGGIAAAPFTGGASLAVTADGARRVISSIGDSSQREKNRDFLSGEEKKQLSSYEKQLAAFKSSQNIGTSKYQEALFNIGQDVKLLEVRLDKEAQRLTGARSSALSSLRDRELAAERNLGLVKSRFRGFQVQNNIAIRKINDEFTTYFKQFVDQKAIFSGYREAAIDGAEASDFFTGLDVRIAGAKTLAGRDAFAGAESGETQSNRLLNDASKTLSAFNLAQDKAFQQTYRNNQALVNQLLNIRGREKQAESTLDLRAIGLRAGTQTLESKLLSQIKETEIQQNYFNELLSNIDERASLVNTQYTQGLSILERSYTLALDAAEQSVESIHERAYENLSISFNNLGSRIDSNIRGYQPSTSGQSLYSSFGDILSKSAQIGLSSLDLDGLGGEETPTIKNTSFDSYNKAFPDTQYSIYETRA